MKPGRFSDGDSVHLSDGRSGRIMRSLGHWHLLPGNPRKPDPAVGPRYEVLMDACTIERDGRTEWTGSDYCIVQDEELSLS